jgi:hypothetical protein
MKRLDFSNRKAGMAAMAASALVLTLAAGPLFLQGAYANRTGIEGCTPGYWKTHVETWQDGILVRVGGADKLLTPDTLVRDAFDVDFLDNSYDSLTLLQALNLNGGGVNALLKSAVAALLDSSELPNPIMDYSLTDDQVYDRTRDALDPQYVVNIADISDDNDTEEKKNFFDEANNGLGGCPLN